MSKWLQWDSKPQPISVCKRTPKHLTLHFRVKIHSAHVCNKIKTANQTLSSISIAYLVNKIKQTISLTYSSLYLFGAQYQRRNVSLMLFFCYSENIYNLYNTSRVKLAKTQYLRSSFARMLLQGKRTYRFISIWELCLQVLGSNHLVRVFSDLESKGFPVFSKVAVTVP